MTTGFVSSSDLESYFVDKDLGVALAGGSVQYWEDANRTTPKVVYQQVNIGSDPVTGQPIYQYVALPNPLTLSAVGTPQDANGNNITVFYYPYDANGNVQLYYVAVFNYLGVQQFTREAWPPLTFSGDIAGGISAGENMLTNPQFAIVNFDLLTNLTFNYSGSGTTVIPIAPDWNLNVSYAGTGTITVTRTSIAGTANLDTNPPYVLTITPGSNISSLTMSQRLNNNPGVWSAITTGMAGYVATAIVLGPSTTATMQYAPNIGAPTQLIMENNTSSEYQQYTNTVQLPPSANTSTSDTGYVDIIIELSTTLPSSLTSIQCISLDSNITGINFIQEPVNRQIDHMFNYYNSRLQYKPINSFLVGWDFPTNPAQPLGSTTTNFAIGANKSVGTWDQTVIFQSVTNGFTTSRLNDGSMALYLSATGQLAVIQYLEAQDVRRMLTTNLSCMLQAYVSSGAAVTGTISLWYTTGGSLPDLSSNLSIVATLDANGKPATFNGTWTEIARSNLGDARFSIPASGTNTPTLIPFSGWAAAGGAAAATATYFAIVVGTASIPSGSQVAFKSISCVPGDIPTLPAPKTQSEVLLDCQRFYTMSFAQGTVPAQNVGVGTGEMVYLSWLVSGAGGNRSQMIPFPTCMRAQPDIVFYNPNAANAFACSEIPPFTDCTTTIVYNNAVQALGIEVVNGAGVTSGFPVGVHFTCDARLGYV